MNKSGRRSSKQAAASRANGAKGRGPTSSDGKAKSAQNAKAHGLTGKINARSTEQDQAQRLIAKLVARFGSNDPRATALIDRAATATLRLNRARDLITQALEDLADPENPRRLEARAINAEIVASVRDLMQEVFGGDEPDHELARVMAEDVGFMPTPERQSRASIIKLMDYARRFRGERDRALSNLERLRLQQDKCPEQLNLESSASP